MPGYDIPVDDVGTNMLTNKKDTDFAISDLEVWQVTYIKPTLPLNQQLLISS